MIIYSPPISGLADLDVDAIRFLTRIMGLTWKPSE
jgi:hypothetical protein